MPITVAEAKQRYRVELWDRVTPVNGVPAAEILAARQDIPDGGVVYLIYRDDQVLYFQPHAPGQAGIVPMTDADALQYAEAQVLALACADIPIEVAASPNPAAVNAVVEVTAALPVDTPDTTVTFAVEGGAPATEPVANGQAVHAYAFARPGTYRISVSSAHHGTRIVEVVVQ
jgi:hypothetical protein